MREFSSQFLDNQPEIDCIRTTIRGGLAAGTDRMLLEGDLATEVDRMLLRRRGLAAGVHNKFWVFSTTVQRGCSITS